MFDPQQPPCRQTPGILLALPLLLALPVAAAERIGEPGFVERFAFLNPKVSESPAGWLSSPEQLDRAFGPPGPTSLRSEFAARSRFVIRQVDGGRSARYLIVSRATPPAPPDSRPPPVWQEWLWPSSELPATDIVYDCTDEVLHGKAKPILCDLSAVPLRVFALLPTQVERLSIRAIQRVPPGTSVRAAVTCGDASDRVIAARLPLHLALIRPDGATYRATYGATDDHGELRIDWPLTPDAPSGAWRLRVRSQLNGLVGELPIGVAAIAAPPAAPPEFTTRELRQQWRSQPLRWPDSARSTAE